MSEPVQTLIWWPPEDPRLVTVEEYGELVRAAHVSELGEEAGDG